MIGISTLRWLRKWIGPSLISVAAWGQQPTTISIAADTSRPLPLQIANNCQTGQQFRIQSDVPWLQVPNSSNLTINGSSSTDVGLTVNSAGMKPGQYSGSLGIICLTCSRSVPPCELNRRDFPLTLVIPENKTAAPSAPTETPVPATDPVPPPTSAPVAPPPVPTPVVAPATIPPVPVQVPPTHVTPVPTPTVSSAPVVIPHAVPTPAAIPVPKNPLPNVASVPNTTGTVPTTPAPTVPIALWIVGGVVVATSATWLLTGTGKAPAAPASSTPNPPATPIGSWDATIQVPAQAPTPQPAGWDATLNTGAQVLHSDAPAQGAPIPNAVGDTPVNLAVEHFDPKSGAVVSVTDGWVKLGPVPAYPGQREGIDIYWIPGREPRLYVNPQTGEQKWVEFGTNPPTGWVPRDPTVHAPGSGEYFDPQTGKVTDVPAGSIPLQPIPPYPGQREGIDIYWIPGREPRLYVNPQTGEQKWVEYGTNPPAGWIPRTMLMGPNAAAAPQAGDRNEGGGHTFSRGTTHDDLVHANRPVTAAETAAATPSTSATDEYVEREMRLRNGMRDLQAARESVETVAPFPVSVFAPLPEPPAAPPKPLTQADLERLAFIDGQIAAGVSTDIWTGIRKDYALLSSGMIEMIDQLRQLESLLAQARRDGAGPTLVDAIVSALGQANAQLPYVRRLGETFLGLSDRPLDSYGTIAWLERAVAEQQYLITLYRTRGADAVNRYLHDQAEMQYYGMAPVMVAGGVQPAVGASFGAATKGMPKPPARTVAQESTTKPAGTGEAPTPAEPATKPKVAPGQVLVPGGRAGEILSHTTGADEEGTWVQVKYRVGDTIDRRTNIPGLKSGTEDMIPTANGKNRAHMVPPQHGVNDPAGLTSIDERINLSTDKKFENHIKDIYRVENANGNEVEVTVTVRRNADSSVQKTWTVEIKTPNGDGTTVYQDVGYKIGSDGNVIPVR
jgi:hypothetical protein